MTYQDAVEVGKIITSIAPQLIILGACFGLWLAMRNKD